MGWPLGSPDLVTGSWSVPCFAPGCDPDAIPHILTEEPDLSKWANQQYINILKWEAALHNGCQEVARNHLGS